MIVMAGFQQGLVSADGVRAVLDRMPRAHRRALIAEAVTDAEAGAQSLPEVHFLRLCRRLRLPTPSLQHRRTDSAGQVRYLDAYFEQWGVHVEIDGGQHTDVREWWADMRRQNALWIPGDRVLRFPAWAIRHQPAEVATQLRAALTAAGWSAGPSRSRGGTAADARTDHGLPSTDSRRGDSKIAAGEGSGGTRSGRGSLAAWI